MHWKWKRMMLIVGVTDRPRKGKGRRMAGEKRVQIGIGWGGKGDSRWHCWHCLQSQYLQK